MYSYLFLFLAFLIKHIVNEMVKQNPSTPKNIIASIFKRPPFCYNLFLYFNAPFGSRNISQGHEHSPHKIVTLCLGQVKPSA